MCVITCHVRVVFEDGTELPVADAEFPVADVEFPVADDVPVVVVTDTARFEPRRGCRRRPVPVADAAPDDDLLERDGGRDTDVVGSSSSDVGASRYNGLAPAGIRALSYCTGGFAPSPVQIIPVHLCNLPSARNIYFVAVPSVRRATRSRRKT